MIKLHRYDKNVYKQYNNFYYECKSNKQRNSLLDFLDSFGVTIPKDYKNASTESKYLKISKKMKKVCLCPSFRWNDSYPNFRCTLEEFVKLFKLNNKSYTIYGGKIQIYK